MYGFNLAFSSSHARSKNGFGSCVLFITPAAGEHYKPFSVQKRCLAVFMRMAHLVPLVTIAAQFLQCFCRKHSDTDQTGENSSTLQQVDGDSGRFGRLSALRAPGAADAPQRSAAELLPL